MGEKANDDCLGVVSHSAFITHILKPFKPSCDFSYTFFSFNFEVEAHNFKFTIQVSDEQHPSSVANTNEPLAGVI